MIKTLRGLDRKKVRAETGLFMAEGGRLVQQGLQNGWQADTIIVSTPGLDRPGTQDLVQTAAKTGARLVEVPERIMGQITRKDNPGMVLGAFRQRQRTLADLSTSSQQAIWIGLYEVRDPGNLGTILRTADCAGLAGVILIGTCCDPYSVEAVRASMGSIFDIPFATASFEAFNAWRAGETATLTAASVNGTAGHTGIPFGERAVILMGNEQSGLPGDLEAACDHLALIPMRGGADSLNLAQATAIMSYEAWRQQGYPGAREA
ncbi:MAG: RNA methyltransferase [Pseudomonadota bacterium]